MNAAVRDPFLQRNCPGCGENASERSIVAKRPAEEQPFDALAQSWHGIFKEKVFFSYHRCDACRLLYAPVYFTEEQLVRLYADMPPNMAEVSSDVLAKTQQGYWAELKRHSDLRGDFLEIGPDVGLFTQFPAKERAFERYYLFEPNAAVYEELRRRTAGADVTISGAMFDMSDIPDRSLSAAAMIHVLDHLIDPIPYLRSLRAKMRDGGILLIVTHDERSLMARALKSRWPAYCLQHPHLFNPTSIRGFLPRAGFSATNVTRSTNYFPLPYLLQHGVQALGLPHVTVPRFGGVQLALKLGNIITMAQAQ